MNLKILSLGEMVAVGHGLVEEQAKTIEAIPAVAWLYPQLKAVHEVLVQLEGQTRAQTGVTALTAELRHVDMQHDECVRSIYGSLTAYAQWLRSENPDDPNAQAAEDLRDRLYPQGLSVINLTYLEEAGLAIRTVSQLATTDKALAATIPFHDGDLLRGLHRWERLGARLEDLTRKRSLLAEAPSNLPSLSTAKNEWVGVIKLMLEVLERSPAPAMQKDRLRQPVVAASQAAVMRSKVRENRGDSPLSQGGAHDDLGEPIAEVTTAPDTGVPMLEA